MRSPRIQLLAAALSLVACRVDAAPPAGGNARDSAPATAQKGKAAMETHWTRPSPEELEARKKALPQDAYRVTQKEGTEPPFHNAYWNQHGAGIYVDVVSGEPLFASTQKFDSGTGWPSFWAPLEKDNVVTHADRSLMMERTEVRSRLGNSHLGHVFDDGPKPTGLRYCINSASLRFIPVDRLAAEGYGEYLKLFEKK
jgi:methionine-R-sulfoxide reductase